MAYSLFLSKITVQLLPDICRREIGEELSSAWSFIAVCADFDRSPDKDSIPCCVGAIVSASGRIIKGP